MAILEAMRLNSALNGKCPRREDSQTDEEVPVRFPWLHERIAFSRASENHVGQSHLRLQEPFPLHIKNEKRIKRNT